MTEPYPYSQEIGVVGWTPGVIANVTEYLPDVQAPSHYKDEAKIAAYIRREKEKNLVEASTSLLTGTVGDYNVGSFNPNTHVWTKAELKPGETVLDVLSRFQWIVGWKIHAFLNLMFLKNVRDHNLEVKHYWARTSEFNKRVLLMSESPRYLVDPIEVLGGTDCVKDLNLFMKVWLNGGGEASFSPETNAEHNRQLVLLALSKLC